MEKNLHAAVCGFVAAFFVLAIGSGCSTHRAELEPPPVGAPPTADSCQIAPPPSPVLEPPTAGGPINFAAYVPTPEALEVCGEPVPLNNQEVWERFDKEFTIVVYNNAQVYLWLKRMQRQFPWLEKQLRAMSLPDDLKYLIVEETDLLPRTWLAKTNNGRFPGADSVVQVGEQRAFELAVDGLLAKLKDLRSRLPNWTSTVAAYYCGEARLKESMSTQRTTDWYRLQLPPAVETNVFRFMAIKAVLSHARQYGYSLPYRTGN